MMMVMIDNYLPCTHLAAVVGRTDEQYVLVGCTRLVKNAMMMMMMMMMIVVMMEMMMIQALTIADE